METILLVDDTKEITDVLVKVVEKEGYTVLFAYSGEQALQKCRGVQVDLLITDFYMPMGGLELITELKEQQEEPFKIILFSGSGILENPSLLSAQKTLGIDATLSKPIDYHELLDTIKRVLSEK